MLKSFFQILKENNLKFSLLTEKVDEYSMADKAKMFKRIYTFNDAWSQWKAGNKFSIAFYGDSTVDGNNTTGYVANTLGRDSQSSNTFCKKLETNLRLATGNDKLRIYNAGFSGKDSAFGVANINAEFGIGTDYSDVKMVGIGWGINDRLNYSNTKAYRDGFKANIISQINWFYSRGIQPFLLTTQAIVSPNVDTQYVNQYPLRTAEVINSIANEVKRELSVEYNLELIDINKFTERFLLYSSTDIATLIPDRLHFGDIGHQYEADLIFAHISPQVIFVETDTKIDYSTQKVINGVYEDKLTYSPIDQYGFKLYAKYLKSDRLDTKIMETWVFINSKDEMILKSYVSYYLNTYIKINGVIYKSEALETVLSNLSLGLYHLEVFSGLINNIDHIDCVDFKGFHIKSK